MVTAANYPIEKYTVQTEDNYILAVYRIPASPKSAKKANREAVLLIHGLLLSAVDYIVSGPKKALGNDQLRTHSNQRSRVSMLSLVHSL